MRLVLVRHAQTAANAEGRWQGHEEFELSPAGRAQAEKLYRRFQHEGLRPTYVYSSPLRRAFDTAEILARSWQVTVSPWDDLKEHGVGVFSGLTWDQIEARYPEAARGFENTRGWDAVPDAEPVPDRRDRGVRVIDEAMVRHGDHDVLLMVTHGGILQHFLAALMGTDRTWGLSIENTALFDFSVDLEQWQLDGDARLNTSLWRINRFNDASHLT